MLISPYKRKNFIRVPTRVALIGSINEMSGSSINAWELTCEACSISARVSSRQSLWVMMRLYLMKRHPKHHLFGTSDVSNVVHDYIARLRMRPSLSHRIGGAYFGICKIETNVHRASIAVGRVALQVEQ